MNSGWIGIFIAGVLGGSFAIPAKKIKRLHWEQTWLIYCVVALLVLPIGLALFFAPTLFSDIFSSNLTVVAKVVICGASWGIGAALFAMSIPRLGFALAYAIVCGSVTLVGSIGPIVVGAAQISEREGERLVFGLGLLITAIGACAWASILRDRNIIDGRKTPPSMLFSLVGIAIAVLSGALSAMLNIGFAYGGGMIAQATAGGISPLAASLAVWVPACLGGFAVNLVVSSLKIKRLPEPTFWRGNPLSDWLRASSLGVLWFGAILLYSISSPRLGMAGTVYGWAVNGGVAILTSAAWGVHTGEWRHATRSARLWALAAVGLFLAAFAVLATKG